MPTTPPTVNAMPTAPDPNDRATFNARAYPWSVALAGLTSEVNAATANVYANAGEAAANASTATAKAAEAASSAAAAGSAAGAAVWVSGQTYAQYAAVISPVNFLIYRRSTASGSGTTDPSLDPTNWSAVGSIPSQPSPAGANLYLAANFGAL